jgi:transposase-like protein
VLVNGRRIYLYRLVDSRSRTIDFPLAAKRNAETVKRLLRNEFSWTRTVNPVTTTTEDKNAACANAPLEVKRMLSSGADRGCYG